MSIVTNRKLSKQIIVFYLSISTLIFFLVLLIINELKYDAMVIGVLRELLTLPFLALLIILLLISIVSLIKERFKINSYPFFSLIILILTTALLILKS